jgi:hypothetical protein
MWREYWALWLWEAWIVIDGWIIGRVTYEWDASISSRPNVRLCWTIAALGCSPFTTVISIHNAASTILLNPLL